jgi:hypothetical protein
MHNMQSTNPFNLDEMSRFDKNPAVSAIKAALPHLEPRHRRVIGVIIKMLEIQALLSSYRDDLHGFNENWSNQPGVSGSERLRNMLGSIRPFMNENTHSVCDTLLGIMDMKEALESGNFNFF